ncbi:uncharacterized protein [Aegilops tauschii subsp. strangulata]|uniref:uncharacterized protein n=1 Tax=Aegilops tauschii subsp. strangulata TaxID=200361 RepID=UPI00098BC8F2|nr:uncharacterized protein LOC109772050 isoform X2 [Aegilops tauschii subsp. strangulata]XP_044397399.1 uncharacterized protein LOC123121471 [Triticum aestivum]
MNRPHSHGQERRLLPNSAAWCALTVRPQVPNAATGRRHDGSLVRLKARAVVARLPLQQLAKKAERPCAGDIGISIDRLSNCYLDSYGCDACITFFNICRTVSNGQLACAEISDSVNYTCREASSRFNWMDLHVVY